MSKTFIVTTQHPTGWKDGEHRLVVHESHGKPGCFYVTGAGFGCSRDYRGTEEHAIRMLLSEHACTAVKITEEN